MKLKLCINEFEEKEKDDCEVVFEGYPRYCPATPQTLEYPGDDETWECDNVTYDKSKYTPEECLIIDTYLLEAATAMEEIAMEEVNI